MNEYSSTSNETITETQFQEILRQKAEGTVIAQPVEDWVSEGSPIEAVHNMLRRLVVTSAEFHRVYARILDSELVDDERIRKMFDYMLHETGTAFDNRLMREGKICTVRSGHRWAAPEEIGTDEETMAQWAFANLSIEDRIGV